MFHACGVVRTLALSCKGTQGGCHMNIHPRSRAIVELYRGIRDFPLADTELVKKYNLIEVVPSHELSGPGLRFLQISIPLDGRIG